MSADSKQASLARLNLNICFAKFLFVFIGIQSLEISDHALAHKLRAFHTAGYGIVSAAWPIPRSVVIQALMQHVYNGVRTGPVTVSWRLKGCKGAVVSAFAIMFKYLKGLQFSVLGDRGKGWLEGCQQSTEPLCRHTHLCGSMSTQASPCWAPTVDTLAQKGF